MLHVGAPKNKGPPQVVDAAVDVADMAIGPISSAAANATTRLPTEQVYAVAMLRKAQDATKAQGEAAVRLIDAAAAPPVKQEGLGTLVDDMA